MKKLFIVALFAFASFGFSTLTPVTQTVDTAIEIVVTNDTLDVLEAGAEVTRVIQLKNGQILVTYDDGTYEIFD